MSNFNEDELYILKLFSTSAIFSGLTQTHLRNILPFSQKFQFPTGSFIIREGSNADGFFVIAQGRVEVLKMQTNKVGDYKLTELGAGQCFGELAIIDQSPRSASIKTLEPTTVLKISIDNIDRLADIDSLTYTTILKNIAIDLSRRLRYTNELVVLRAKQ